MSILAREAAELAFDRLTRPKSEPKTILQQEQAKHQAAVKNMHRLRLLRLKLDEQKYKGPPAIAFNRS
jgi:hypothetical protein